MPETTTERGLLLPCPLCGAAEAVIHLDLSDLDTCHCQENECEFSLADLEARMKVWSDLVAWTKSAPCPAKEPS